MDKNLFDRLTRSMEQMNEIDAGTRAPSREFHVDAARVQEIRANTGLSQQKFAKVLLVDVGTLRNWEQGRRTPTGPAKALLRAIANDAHHVLTALQARPAPVRSAKSAKRGARTAANGAGSRAKAGSAAAAAKPGRVAEPRVAYRRAATRSAKSKG